MTLESNIDLSKINIISSTNSYFQLIPIYIIRKYGGFDFLTTVITKSTLWSVENQPMLWCFHVQG
jgi:hypothetical protein